MNLQNRSKRRNGFTLLEVVISSAVLSVALIASSAAFSSNLMSTEKAKRITTGTLFLGTVTEDVIAQDYANLLALNGNQILDAATLADSNYSVDLSVFVAGLDIIQIRAILTDLSTSTEVGRIVTLRRND